MDLDSKKKRDYLQVMILKLTLIAWKTIRIQMFHKKTICKLFLYSFLGIPIILMLTFAEPTVQKKRIFDTIKIDNIDKLRESIPNIQANNTDHKLVFKISYMPKNPLYEKVIRRTVKKLQLDGYESVDNYEDMTLLMQTEKYMAGISFPSGNKNITTLPETLKYTLHFSPILSTDPSQQKDWVTDHLYPPMAEMLSRKPGPEADDTDYGGQPNYVREGFIPLQHAIFMSYLELKTGIAATTFPEIVMSKLPRRRCTYEPMFVIIRMLLPIVVLSTYLLPSYYIVKQLAMERESGIIQILPIGRSLNWFVWFVILMVSQFCITLMSTFLLSFSWMDRSAVYDYSDWTTIFTFLLCYVCANTTFLFMVSVVVIPNSSNAIYVIIVHLLTYTPYLLIIIFYYDTPMSVKLLGCLMLNTALGLGLNIIMDFEHTAEGIRWHNIHSAHYAGDVFSLWHVCLMLMLASILHILILFYVDMMHPPDYIAMSVDEDVMARNWYYPAEYLWKWCMKLKKNRKKYFHLRTIGKFLFKSITEQDDYLDSRERGGMERHYGENKHPHRRQLDDKNTQTLPSDRGEAPPAMVTREMNTIPMEELQSDPDIIAYLRPSRTTIPIRRRSKSATPSPVLSPITSYYQSPFPSRVPSRDTSTMDEQDPDVDLSVYPRTSKSTIPIRRRSKSVTPSPVPSSRSSSRYQSKYQSPYPSRVTSRRPSHIPSNTLPMEEQDPDADLIVYPRTSTSTIPVRRRSEAIPPSSIPSSPWRVSSQYQSTNHRTHDPDADLIVYHRNSISTKSVRRRSKSATPSPVPSTPSRVSSQYQSPHESVYQSPNPSRVSSTIPSNVSSNTLPMEELSSNPDFIAYPSRQRSKSTTSSIKMDTKSPVRFEAQSIYSVMSTSSESSSTHVDLEFHPIHRDTRDTRDTRDEDIEYVQVDEEPIVNELLYNENRGIQLINISKSYKNTTYLNDITMNIHPNEITVILGRQFAGKQLLMYIIAGAIDMSSGKVIVNGFDINHNDMSKSFAIMPKQKISFGELSARENLYFYTHLRGMRGRGFIKREIHRYLKKLDLNDMADVPVSELSYGMERRLSLCCTLCGGDHTVLCDEPTLGLDKRNRYHMWDLLRLEGRSRTIIVSSKYSEEADVLGDRIAVLYCGELKCFDRTVELHRKFCSDYNLKCVKSNKEKFNLSGLMSVIYRHIPNGVRIERNTDHHIDLCLPSIFKHKLAGVMRDLEKRGTQYGLTDCWLQHRSLRDTFMVSPPLQNEDERSTVDDTGEEHHYVIFDKFTFEKDPSKRSWHKFSAIIRKKITFFKDLWWVILIILALITYFLYSEYEDGIQGSHYLPPIQLNLNTYKATVIVMKISKDVNQASMAYNIGKGCADYHNTLKSIDKDDHEFRELRGNREVVPYILFQELQSILGVETFYLGGLQIEPNKLICFWNDKLIHSAPIIINLVHNSLARTFMSKQAEVTVVNTPIKFTSQNYLDRLKTKGELNQDVNHAVIILACIIIALLALPIISESTSGTRHLQFIGGVSFRIYWLTEFICDYIAYEFIAIYQIILIKICDTQQNDISIKQYTDLRMLSIMVLLVLLHGVAVLPFVYLLTFRFKNVINGFVATLFILVGSSYLVKELIPTLQTVTSFEDLSFLIQLFRWSPPMNLLLGLGKLHIAGEQHSTCETLGGCAGDAQCCLIQPYLSLMSPGILLDVIILVILAVVYNLLLSEMKPFVMENFQRGRRERKGSMQSSSKNENDDRSIALERQRIYNLRTSERERLPLVVQDVNKKLGGRQVLFNIAFTVRRNDVFGLVGLFGSGKSTIVKHVVGLVSIDSGNVFVHGIDVRKDMRQAQEQIGFCPRTNALFNYMTVREIFQFYSKLQCRKSEYVPKIINELAKAFSLTGKLDVRINDLIYATRRKLNVAIAVLCGHSIVILDEPTNGMDPNGRFEVWRMINLLHKVDRTVVLATDNIEECIAVCNRIGIMVNGRIKALGNLDQLTTQYSRGCMVHIYESNLGISRRLNENRKYKNSSQMHKVSVMGYMGMETTESGSGSSNSSSDDSPMSNSGYSDGISVTEIVDEADIDVDQVRLYLQNMSAFKVNPQWEKRAHRYKDIKSFMLNELPSARLHEEYANCLIYYIPFKDLSISQVFELMESITSILNIIFYKISRTSMMEIYEEFAKERARLWGNETTVDPTKLAPTSKV